MNEAAGDWMLCRPMSEDWGEGATNDPGEGTCRPGLPGELAVSSVPGEGVPIRVEGLGFTWKS